MNLHTSDWRQHSGIRGIDNDIAFNVGNSLQTVVLKHVASYLDTAMLDFHEPVLMELSMEVLSLACDHCSLKSILMKITVFQSFL